MAHDILILMELCTYLILFISDDFSLECRGCRSVIDILHFSRLLALKTHSKIEHFTLVVSSFDNVP